MQTGRWMSLRHRSKNKMEANEVHIAHLWNLWTSGGFSWTGTVNHPPDLSRSSIHQWPMAVHGLYKLKIRLFSGKPLVATETRELSQLQTSLRNCHCLRAQPTECKLVEPVSWFVPHSSLAFHGFRVCWSPEFIHATATNGVLAFMHVEATSLYSINYKRWSFVLISSIPKMFSQLWKNVWIAM